MKIINIEQGSPEWLEMRKSHITATDCAVIMGKSPWMTPYELWQQKLGKIPPTKENAAMIRGRKLEAEAREQYEDMNYRKMPAAVVVHDDREWQMASLDGLSDDHTLVLEIKCGEKALEQARDDIIPEYYMLQMQHQLMVTGLETCHYFCYLPDKGFMMLVAKRNEELIQSIIEKEEEFYECLKNEIEPPATEKDYVLINTQEAFMSSYAWGNAKEGLVEAQRIEKKARESVLKHTDDGNCIVGSAKCTRIEREGSVDLKALCSEYGITDEQLKKFKKPGIGFWKLSKIKD